MTQQFWNKTNQCLLMGLFAATVLVSHAAWAVEQRASSHDLTVGPEEVTMLSAGRDITMDGTKVTGNVSAGRTVRAEDCTVHGQLSSGQDVSLTHCSFVNSLSAGRNVRLSNTTVSHHANAGRDLVLTDAVVQGDAAAGGNVSLDRSRVEGTLSVAVPILTLRDGTLNNVRFTQGTIVNNSSSVFISQGGGVSVNGNGSVVVSGRSSNPIVSVGPRSVSNVNGYVIRGADNQTTLITPDNTIYINGTRVSGSGPKSYTEYRRQNVYAPTIQGPGWRDAGNVGSTGGTHTQSITTTSTTTSSGGGQVLELMGNSTVTGKVTFEGGNGIIRVHPGTRFAGTVEGGRVEKL